MATSKKQQETFDRAKRRGFDAFVAGLPRDRNPYNPTATWGVGWFAWQSGWTEAKKIAEDEAAYQRRRVARAADMASSEYWA